MPRTPDWLDHVLAAPAIGIATTSWMAFASGVWEAIERMQPAWRSDGLGASSVHVASAIDIRINREGGLYLALSPSSVVAGFTYNMSTVDTPGGLPQLRPASTSKPYSHLQTMALSLLVDFVKTGFGVHREHEVSRIGLVAESRLVESEAPPGVQRFVNDLAGAVRGRLTVADGNLLAELTKSERHSDQCHHFISRNSIDRPEDLVFRMDWQRLWQPPTVMNVSRLRDELESVTSAANAYFESFGSGQDAE